MDVPDCARWDWVKSRANDLTRIFSSPPVPVMEIAESNGVEVVFAGFGDYHSEVAGLCDFGKAKLYVNRDDITERQ